MNGLAQRVKELRERKGWSMQRLAEEAGIARSYVSKIEAGAAVRPSGIMLNKLANALGVEVDDLMIAGGYAKPKPKTKGALSRAQIRHAVDRAIGGQRWLSEEAKDAIADALWEEEQKGTPE